MVYHPIQQLADNMEALMPSIHGLYLQTRKQYNTEYLYLVDRYRNNSSKYLGKKSDLSPKMERYLDWFYFSRGVLKNNRTLIRQIRKDLNIVMDRKTSKILRALSSIGAFEEDYALVGTHACNIYKAMAGGSLNDLPIGTLDIDLLNLSGQSDVFRTLTKSLKLQFNFTHELDFVTGSYFHEEGSAIRLVDILCAGETLDYANKVNDATHGTIYGFAPTGIEFLQENTFMSTMPVEDGYMVRVPQPARFALHKYFVSHQRKDAAKASKDLQQAVMIDKAFRDEPLTFAVFESFDEALAVMPENIREVVVKVRERVQSDK